MKGNQKGPPPLVFVFFWGEAIPKNDGPPTWKPLKKIRASEAQTDPKTQLFSPGRGSCRRRAAWGAPGGWGRPGTSSGRSLGTVTTRGRQFWVWTSKLSRRGKPQVLGHASTYQGPILEFRFFEAQPFGDGRFKIQISVSPQ